MPTDTCFVTSCISDHQACLAFDQIGRQCRGALAQALVGLLESDDIGVKLRDDTGDPMGVTPTVKSDAFADIPGCKPKV